MIRLLLVLLVVAGAVYFLVLNKGEEAGRVDVEYKENVQQIDDMEKQMLQNAQDQQKKADAMSQ
jgi:CHASE3 domain sensor protein